MVEEGDDVHVAFEGGEGLSGGEVGYGFDCGEPDKESGMS